MTLIDMTKIHPNFGSLLQLWWESSGLTMIHQWRNRDRSPPNTVYPNLHCPYPICLLCNKQVKSRAVSNSQERKSCLAAEGIPLPEGVLQHHLVQSRSDIVLGYRAPAGM